MKLQAYIYVDKENALDAYRQFQIKNPDDFEKMMDKDKNWLSVQGGYLILIATDTKSPKEKLDEYSGRTAIETFFKTSKEYLKLMPISKWNDDTVRGKILSDIISSIIFLLLRKSLNKNGVSTSKLIGATQSLMCTKKSNGTVQVEVPNKQVKAFYENLSFTVPSSVDLKSFKQEMLLEDL